VAKAICFLGGTTLILHIIYVDLNAEARVRSQASPCEICRDKVALKQVPPPPSPPPPTLASTAPHLSSTLILFLSEGQAAEASETSNKAVIFQTSGSDGQTESTLALLCFRPASDELD